MYNPDQDLPDCMMPDGGEACGSYARLYAAFKEQALKLKEAELERDTVRTDLNDRLADVIRERDSLALRLDESEKDYQREYARTTIMAQEVADLLSRLEAYRSRSIDHGSVVERGTLEK